LDRRSTSRRAVGRVFNFRDWSLFGPAAYERRFGGAVVVPNVSVISISSRRGPWPGVQNKIGGGGLADPFDAIVFFHAETGDNVEPPDRNLRAATTAAFLIPFVGKPGTR